MKDLEIESLNQTAKSLLDKAVNLEREKKAQKLITFENKMKNIEAQLNSKQQTMSNSCAKAPELKVTVVKNNRKEKTTVFTE